MKMNILIVEDEPLACERLEDLIRDYDPHINISCTTDTVKEAVHLIKKYHDQLDLLFLDIQLADGKSFEIFDHLNCLKPVIFTTAYDEYTLKAFKLNSIDYLLKPVKYPDLENALNKFRQLKLKNEELPYIDKELINQLLHNNGKSYKKRFLVKYGQKIQYKSVEEISHIIADGKICYIIPQNSDKKYIIDHTLEELDEELLDPACFFRINRQVILNIDDIEEVRNHYNSRLEVKLKTQHQDSFVVSRNRVKSFKNWLDS